MEIIKVNIRKPLYGNFCYINAKIVNSAIRKGALLEITVPNGTAQVNPQKWKDTGKVMSKVFKFVDNPMILYGNHVPVPLPLSNIQGKIEENTNLNQLTLF
jgi:hypothetical protein